MHNQKLNLNVSTLNEKTSPPTHDSVNKERPDATLNFVKLKGLILVFFSTL